MSTQEDTVFTRLDERWTRATFAVAGFIGQALKEGKVGSELLAGLAETEEALRQLGLTLKARQAQANRAARLAEEERARESLAREAAQRQERVRSDLMRISMRAENAAMFALEDEYEQVAVFLEQMLVVVDGMRPYVRELRTGE